MIIQPFGFEFMDTEIFNQAIQKYSFEYSRCNNLIRRNHEV